MNLQSSSALTRAAANGRTEIVKTLLARPEIDISEPVSCFIALLLDYACDSHPSLPYLTQYALYFAAEKGYIDIVQVLLACPDINVNFVGMVGSLYNIKTLFQSLFHAY